MPLLNNCVIKTRDGGRRKETRSERGKVCGMKGVRNNSERKHNKTYREKDQLIFLL
jgi:hypothetical protein